MSHNVLLKYGWQVVFESKHLTVYEFENYQYYKWVSGRDKLINRLNNNEKQNNF